MKRGRKTLSAILKKNFGVQTQGQIFPVLSESLGEVTSMKEALRGLSTMTDGKVNPTAVPFRKMLRAGAKNGHLRKGTPLHALTKISRGRPLGFSPKKAVAELVSV